MKKLIIAFLLLIPFLTAAQPDSLSAEAKISVLTFGPYQGELYSAFGHSAIRVYDPVHGIDDAYNWGVFDFNQPNFYLNFAKGFLYYKLGVFDYDRMRDYYIYFNRYVHEQNLNLNKEEKQKLYQYLLWNAQPENQNYRYDYFYNNCATKVRDVLVTVFGNEVVFDGSYIKTDYTIRQLTDLYLTQQPWGDVGIDICLGLPMDKKADPYEYMFLPDYIESGFNNATLHGKPLVSSTEIIYESVPEENTPSVFSPTWIFTAFAALMAIFSWVDFKRKKTNRGIDFLLFFTLGVIGILLFFLWFFTDHKAAAVNFNLLWAFPLHLLFAFSQFGKNAFSKQYAAFALLLTILTLLGWSFWPQQLNIMLVPLVIGIALRLGVNYIVRKELAR
ncbi:MAG: DUF4105 domain-containing protein [Cyclobacteriaceae bacterium]|jgi:hypothetical protein|nr:DUF4105 domain-containing protein [Cytophagales bacterium]MCZ8328003.1 DUF4105 domain-containing protein [Cyclobacteriaceae bacterium]